MKTRPGLLILLLATAAPPARAESLYDERSYHPLTADRKALRAGDILTVLVYENSSATSSTETSTQRRNELEAALRVLNEKSFGANVAAAGAFTGGGATQRANKLLATVTVTVRQVLSNGDLRVNGEQVLTVNDELHKVSIEGRVRPQDVSSENVVVSTRMADVRIQYTGDGELSERQRRPWWRVFLDWLGL